ncbi:hypothetical protein RhiirA1_447912 [Rhizophagus irregularis]|uniref:Uncharacterized protein n=1 Tax=Rhizophagus irregularis TaxID=588596 RepID=A0A2N0SKT3_9GLOM|nr:hypothetical protein RhiirA1_447912 [Rhizophagus irregularis]
MDNEYFRWAILSALYPVGQKAEHIAQYRQYVNELNFEVNKQTRNEHATLVCQWCISHFTHNQEIHDKHMAICQGIKHSPQADRMPNPKKGENVYQFKNWKRRMQVPYYFVADFEAILKPIINENHINKTKKIQEHIPCSFAYMKIQEEIHNNAEHCWVCEKEFGRPEEKVRDHCHITGYDSHMIMQGIGAMECKDEIEPIPYNMEIYGIQVRITPIYRQYAIHEIRCLEILEIFIKKGVYLYEYMDSWSKFDKVNLPLKNVFYSKLNNTHISDSEYEYVQYVWKKSDTNSSRVWWRC